jgi:hypothetical protein
MGGVLERSSSISSPLKENAQILTGLGQLQPGDVVRWNRLEVRNDFDDEEEVTTAKKRKLSDNKSDEAPNLHRPLLRVKCDLSLSWTDPATGPSLARLCRITPRQSSMQRQQQEDGYDLEWEHIIHPSMETPKETVLALARWYSANAGPHFSKVCVIFLYEILLNMRNVYSLNHVTAVYCNFASISAMQAAKAAGYYGSQHPEPCCCEGHPM